LEAKQGIEPNVNHIGHETSLAMQSHGHSENMPTFFTLHYFAAANMKRKLDGKKQFKKKEAKKIIIKYYYE
jgi:hypothetical protein